MRRVQISVICTRFARYLYSRKQSWIIIEEYSNTKHSSFEMTPTEASDKKYEGIVYFKLYGGTEQILSKPKFK